MNKYQEALNKIRNIVLDESGDCIGQRRIKEWIKKPYQKQTFKLTKFEIDLLQSFLKGHPLRYQFKNINALRMQQLKIS